ncbi:hypothetical protein OM076_14785 [Solirubrobacter ginsenosidimutans]|uniref:Uncharacterized protein n=1 Tax=Solirubrobacter ginsenosidimutans TaxID=490573 RepID=A0A9X3MUJ9_9ACTN|nr:hypothetical protein [Solirubrobacter ginsenosidimutans]MDA0161540.1 hypothetical protein [Solirubrobacter ginsenosidimutans]
MKAVIAALFFLAFAAPAQASFTVTPSTTQAGAHADVTIHDDFDATPTRVALHFPPGLVGNPNAVPKCAVATFEAGACPEETRVGRASALSREIVPLPASGYVYNLVPQPGEPARLGIDIGFTVVRVRNQASVTLRPDGGLDSTIAQLDDKDLGLTQLDITLYGTMPDHVFMRLPTSCAPATVSIEADAPASATFTPTGCANVPFAPSIAAKLDTSQRVVPSGATVTLTLPADQAHVRRAEIALPVGTTLSPGVANGLQACTDAQFTSGDGCPAASQVGTVTFVTPLLGSLGGKVYFGDGFRLYIVVQGSGVLVKIPGDVKLDPATGQITTIFDNLPQVPFTSFALTFQGGSHAVLANPSSCGTKNLSAVLTPWSGTAPKTVGASFTIDADGHGGACTLAAFNPALRIGADSTAAGRPAGAVTLEVSRADGTQDLTRVTTELPPGLAGSLKGVPVCADAAADAGACPAESRVGSVSSLAGTGDAPVALNGAVYLTGAYDGGFAGLAIVIPGKVGPVDLGTVIVRGSIALRPDGGLTVRTTPLPRLIGGVPVSIRQLALTFDRPGFILNASSCAPQEVRAVLEGADGGTSTVTAPYQATDCAGLPFSPRIEATIGKRGQTAPGKAPALRVVVTVPAGNAATAVANVGLPPVLTADLKRLAKACAPAVFAASACPAGARVGTATATTPLLPTALTSPVTFAVPQAGSLPGLALSLTGAVTLPLFGEVGLPGADGVIHNTFNGIPDVPLEQFALSFTGGATMPLTLRRDLCTGPRQTIRGTFTAHSGVVANVSARMKVAGCAPTVALTRHGHRLTVRITAGRDGAAIKSATLTAPGAKRRSVKTRQTITLKRLPGRKTFRVVVKDKAGESWTLKPRAKTR